MVKGKIIILNGTSSSGKTTIAKKLSEKLPNYFVLGLDDVGDLIFKMRGNKREPSTWSIIEKQNYSLHFKTFIYHRLIKIISEYSFNIILDTVFDSDDEHNDFFQQFKDEDVLYVGVFCPLAELEKREFNRGDRQIGTAKSQIDITHKDMNYDVEINTYENTIEECIEKILSVL